MSYALSIFDPQGRVLLREGVSGETPSVGDLVTAHPDGAPGEESLTARVTGIQRVLKPVVDPPGSPRSRCFFTTSHIAVTAKVEQ